MRENYRNSIASIEKFPQFTTMHVIDGQAGLIICASLIFYSLTIDNILNIIVLIIIAAITISTISGNDIISNTKNAKEQAEIESELKVIGTATNQAKNMNKYGDLEEENFQNALEASAGKNKTVLKYYKTENMYTVTFNASQRTYQVNDNGNAKYVGEASDAIMIITDLSRSLNSNGVYNINITLKTFAQNNINEINYIWTNSENEPDEREYKTKSVTTPENDTIGNIKTTNVQLQESNETPEGKYYLHVKVTKNDGKFVTEKFGPYLLGKAEVKLAVDPNGGTWNGKTGVVMINGKQDNTAEIQDATIQKKFNVILKEKSEKEEKVLSNKEINIIFDRWNLENGVGTITESKNGFSTYTFGSSTGIVKAQYAVDTIKLPEKNDDEYKKKGYTLIGWKTSDGTTIEEGSMYTPKYSKDKKEELIAIYEKNIYTVTYEKGANVAEIGKTTEKTTEKVILPTITASTGYTTTGWYNGNTKIGNAGDEVSIIENITFTAKAEDKTSAEITLASTNNLKTTKQTATLTATDGVGVTAYYWGTTSPTNSSTYQTVSSTTSLNITKDITEAGTYYFASKDAAGNVSDIKSITMQSYVVYNMLDKIDGTQGSYTTGNYDQKSKYTYIAPKGTNITASKVYTEPDSTGIVYKGMASIAPSTSSANVATTASVALNSNLNLSYWWNRNTYTVTYNSNNDSETTLTDTVKYQQDYATKTNTFTKEGYKFYRWSTKSDGTGTKYTENQKFTVSQNLQLYVIWDTSWQDDYTFNLDETNKIITLSKYNGSATDITLPRYAIEKGVQYKTALITGQDDTVYSGTTVQNLAFENGFEFGESANQIFKNATNLKSINLSNVDTSKTKYMSGLFYNCTGLTNVNLTGTFSTANATYLQSMFYKCGALTSIDLSNFNTTKAIYMNNMFQDCSGLTSLDVTGFVTSNVTNMQYMFQGCSNLSTINVTGFVTTKVTNMEHMFMGCSNLTTLDVSGFVTGNVTNMQYMFYECNKLETINVSNFDTEKVTKMGDMFYNCKVVKALDVGHFKTSNCNDMHGMFYACNALESLDVSDWNTAKVEDMRYTFLGCRKISVLDVSKWNTTSVTKMEQLFQELDGITTLDLSSFNTSKVKNMSNMFYSCDNLTTIFVGDDWSTSAVTSSNQMFLYINKIKGGMGTTYNNSKTDKEYAHVDGGTSNPGYFTYKQASSTNGIINNLLSIKNSLTRYVKQNSLLNNLLTFN